jgi:hypothetical protein
MYEPSVFAPALRFHFAALRAAFTFRYWFFNCSLHFLTPFLAACCCGPLHSFWSGLFLRLRLRNLRRNFFRAAGRIRPFRFAFSRFSATSLACLNVGPFFAKPLAKSAFTLFCYCHVSPPYCCRLTSHRLWICTIWTPKRLRTRRGRL